MIDISHTQSPEWQNENALRAYPLEDDAPAAALLPTWFLADLRLTVSTAYDTIYVSSAYLSDTLLSIGISGVAGANPPVGLLARTVTRDELEPFRAYSLDALTDTASGTVSFGEPPVGVSSFKYAFSATEAPLVTSALVRVTPPGITRLVDPAHGTSVSGIVDLSGNSEFRTSLDPDSTHPNTILVTLEDLYRDLTTSVCSSAPALDACGRTPVTSVNGVTPTTAGVLTLRFR